MPFKQHPDNPDLVIYKTNEYCLPKPWVGLTDEELVEIREAHQANIFNLMFAVEAKLKEKNDAPVRTDT